MKIILFVVFVVLIFLLLMGGFSFMKTRLNDDDELNDYVYRPAPIVVEHTLGETTKSSYYITLSDALLKAEEGDVIRLLSDIELGVLSETFIVDKCITIDGLKSDGGMWKITAKGNVDMFTLNGGDLTLQNVYIDYISPHDESAMISAYMTKGNLYVSNSVLFSKYRTIFFYEQGYENEIVINQNSVIMSTDASETIYFSSYRYSNHCSTITVENALIAAAKKYAINLNNKKGFLYLKEGARIVTNGSAPEIKTLFNVDKFSGDYPIRVAGPSSSFKTIIYDNTEFLSAKNLLFYYTRYAVHNNKNVYFSEDYSASKVLVEIGRSLFIFTLQEALVAYPNGSVRVPCNVDARETLVIHGDTSFVSGVADTNGDGLISESTITYSGTGNAFEIGNHKVTFTNVNVVAGDNVAFNLGKYSYLTLGQGVGVTTNGRIFYGFDGAQTVIVVENALVDALKSEDYVLLFDSNIGYRIVDILTDQTVLAGAYVKGTNFTERDSTWDDMVKSYELYLDSEAPYYSEQNKEICALEYDVIVPDSVTHVDMFDANSIVFSKTTTTIGSVYVSCNIIYIKATTPPELLGSLEGEMGVPPTIVVTIGCGEIYKTADGWSDYADYIIEGEMPI